jgi:hypothetical protein
MITTILMLVSGRTKYNQHLTTQHSYLVSHLSTSAISEEILTKVKVGH